MAGSHSSSRVLLLIFSVLVLVLRGHDLPKITDPEFISACVTNHNRARASVQPPAANMRYMTWDERLAMVARAWGQNCLFEHNIKLREKKPVHPQLPSVGENIWAGAPPSIFSVESAIKMWVQEVQHYDYNTLKCTNICGHYTQVVWAESYKVGCAVVDCPGGVRNTDFSHRPGAIFICNYATAGNYQGVPPYKRGPACSQCGGERCEENLCRNSTRDSETGDKWTAGGVCDEFCITVLIIRPASLLFTFISVYVVQRRCPNIFAYIK